MKPPSHFGFSLVEVAIALGVFSFALLGVIGLLSVGIRSNQVSVEETRASALLTMLETDLRNTPPGSNSSTFFHLPLPYALSNSARVFNPTLVPAIGSPAKTSFYTTGLDSDEQPVNFGTNSRPRYQASVIYLNVPGEANSTLLKPVTARIVVSWPGDQAAGADDVVNPAKVKGTLEAVVTFPAP